ncbi:MAG: signal peptidase II [Idiomarina sp.]|nr:signal peptidase II [Idiomarina sp.]
MVKPAHWKQSGLTLLWLSLIVLVLDQVTKLWIVNNLHLFQRIDVLPFFDIIHVRNEGAAFSFLSNQGGWQRWFFTVLALVISAGLAYMLRQQPRAEWRSNAAFALIIGGALGNVTDRIRLGSVVDFLDFYWQGWHWPAFNVADMAIVGGALLMILDSILVSRKERTQAKQEGKSK